MFSFGASPKESPVKTIAFGGDLKTSPLESKKEETKPVFGGFKFGAEPAKPIVKPAEPQGTTEVKSTPVFGSSLNNNGGFSFGGFGAKPAEPEPIKPQVPGGFAFGGSSMSFGASPTPAPAPATTTASTFMFGASKTENEPPKTFGNFGMNSSPAKSTFPAPTSNSTFPQTNSTNAFSFTAKKEEAAPQIFAFGGKPMEPTNSAPMLFGSQSTAPQQATPVFGASFGASTNNNNNSEFGSKMPSFGNQPQKRSFDFTSSSADVSQSKKFDFGGQQQVNSVRFLTTN